MNFKQFLKLLNEEPLLDLGHERRFKKLGKEANYHLKHENIFPKGQDRIYIPVPGSVTAELDHRMIDGIKRKGKNRKYDLEASIRATGNSYVNVKSITDLKRNRLRITATYTVKDGSRKKEVRDITIDELLKTSTNDEYKKTYYKMWLHNAWRKGPKFDNLAIVVSRNPVDVGGMSTCVGWKSCMNLDTGSMNRYTKQDVEHGTLVAYLIDAKDKNIEYPIGRVLIKTYNNKNETDKYLQISTKTYGVMNREHIAVLQTWLDKFNKGKKGLYAFNNRLYNDRDEELIYKGKKKTFKIGDKVKIIHTRYKDKIGKISNYNSYTDEYYVEFSKYDYKDVKSYNLEKA